MQTVKEKLEWYLNIPIDKEHQQGFSVGFKKGVQFVQKWIDVKEEKPELRVPVLVKMSYTFFNTDIPAKDCCYWNGESWINAIRQQHSNGSVTHWRPIEYPLL